MDPNKALEEIREASGETHRLVLAVQNGDKRPEIIDRLVTAAEALFEYVDELDGWLVNGGFLPKAWKRKR